MKALKVIMKKTIQKKHSVFLDTFSYALAAFHYLLNLSDLYNSVCKIINS